MKLNKTRGQHLTPDERAAVTTVLADGYEAGHTIQEMADITGLAPNTVHKLLREAGVTLRRSGPRSKDWPL